MVEGVLLSSPPTWRQPSKRKVAERKSVAFSEEIWLYRCDKTEDEVQQAWYSREEIATFKNERRFVIQLLRAVDFRLELIDESTCCLRGYEAYFSIEYNKATKFVREAALRAVLAEQHRQRTLTVSPTTSHPSACLLLPYPSETSAGASSSEEALRLACRETSEWALRNAAELGANDAAFAHHLYRIECC
jgi:hypothetical protein